jgi:hypothetical protein
MTRITLILVGVAMGVAALTPGSAVAAGKKRCPDYRVGKAVVREFAVRNYTCGAARKKLKRWVSTGRWCDGGWRAGRLQCSKGKSVIYFNVDYGTGLALAAAGYRNCKEYDLKIGTLPAAVRKAKKVTCKGARAVVAKYGTRPKGKYSLLGDRFSLGSYRCRITSRPYETWWAKCIDGGRAFYVTWGL